MPKSDQKVTGKQAEKFIDAYNAMWYAIDTLGPEASKVAFREISETLSCCNHDKRKPPKRFRAKGSLDDSPPDVK